MARFFVGQRVRIKWSYGWPELAGHTGRIVGVAATPGLRGDAEWEVAPDCWGSDEAPYPSNMGGLYFTPNSSQLEPIQPSGNTPGTMSYQDLMRSLGHPVKV